MSQVIQRCLSGVCVCVSVFGNDRGCMTVYVECLCVCVLRLLLYYRLFTVSCELLHLLHPRGCLSLDTPVSLHTDNVISAGVTLTHLVTLINTSYSIHLLQLYLWNHYG